jgi:hypothetical protein
MLSFKAAIETTRDPDLYARDHATFTREAFKAGAQYHWKKHIPRHFQSFAPAKYGYKPRRSIANAGIFEAVGLNPWSPGDRRNQPYQAFKDKLGLPPNVLSGSLQRMCTGTEPMITATATRGATLRMRVPAYAGGSTGRLRAKKGQTQVTDQQRNILDRIAEMETVSEDEHNTLGRVIVEDYVRRANEPGVRKRKDIT